ncbi:MAG: hypothetical protein AAF085_12180, partial [Planctomycetota bacterium]
MKPSKQAHTLMQAYFSGKSTHEQTQALEAWLRDDPSHVELFVDLALLDGLMLSEQKNEDAAAVLAMLREAEDKAEPDFTLVGLPADATSDDPGERSVTFNDLWSVGRYLMIKGLRSKAAVIGSVAAVLALTAILVIALTAGNETPVPIVNELDTTSDPGSAGPADPVVATLT